ncbi:MAG: PhoH family protein, partial [Nitrospirae bacterium]|nr:PhoH family protein [Nitrospirota bacterium]
MINEKTKDLVTLEILLSPQEGKDLFNTNFRNNLTIIEDTLNVVISQRGEKLFIQGTASDINNTQKLIQHIREFNKKGHNLRPDDLLHILNSTIQDNGKDNEVNIEKIIGNNIPVPSKKRYILPRSEAQRNYIQSIKDYDIVIGIGPAGTGKTYIAMAMAVNAYLTKQVSRIILVRPAVEAGEKLGFLPGDISEKVNPYLRPLYDALYDMMEAQKAYELLENGTIEVAPLAFMRGRTLNDAFIILDEAQNTTSEQMKMFLTRLGFNSKAVITGDITQIDLPKDKPSGLIEIQRVLKDIEEIKFSYF